MLVTETGMVFAGDRNRNREYWWSLSLDPRADHVILSFRTIKESLLLVCLSIWMLHLTKGFLNDSHMYIPRQDTQSYTQQKVK